MVTKQKKKSNKQSRQHQQMEEIGCFKLGINAILTLALMFLVYDSAMEPFVAPISLKNTDQSQILPKDYFKNLTSLKNRPLSDIMKSHNFKKFPTLHNFLKNHTKQPTFHSRIENYFDILRDLQGPYSLKSICFIKKSKLRRIIGCPSMASAFFAFFGMYFQHF